MAGDNTGVPGNIYDIIMDPNGASAAQQAAALANMIRGGRQSQILYSLGEKNVPDALAKAYGGQAAQDQGLLEKASVARAHYGAEAQAQKVRALEATLAAKAREGDLNRQNSVLIAAMKALGKSGVEPPSVAPEVLDLWARQRRASGQYPISGRGSSPQALAFRELIDQRALEQDPNFDPTAVESAVKADRSARSKMQADREKAAAFERTLVSNAKMLAKQSENLFDSGIPAINMVVRSAQGALGDVDVAKAKVGFQSVRDEAARAISTLTGVVSDDVRKKWEKSISEASTQEQLAGILDYIQKETSNRIAGFDSGLSELDARQKARVNAPSGSGGASNVGHAAATPGTNSPVVRKKYNPATGLLE